MPKNSNPLSRFSLASDELRKRIIASSAGEVGTGKTHFWMTAPGPIVIFSLDMGTEGVVEEFRQQGKEIYVQEYEWVPPPVGEDTSFEDKEEFKEIAISIRDKFIEDFEVAVQHARTVVWDKESDIWELFRYAHFGAPNDAPKNYAPLNQLYRRQVNLPKSFDINFGLIRGMKDKWGSRMKRSGNGTQPYNTGEREIVGFSELEGLVHTTLFHRREGGKFLLDVGKSRGPGGQAIQDETLESQSDGPGITFPEFASLVFPDTDVSDWE